MFGRAPSIAKKKHIFASIGFNHTMGGDPYSTQMFPKLITKYGTLVSPLCSKARTPCSPPHCTWLIPVQITYSRPPQIRSDIAYDSGATWVRFSARAKTDGAVGYVLHRPLHKFCTVPGIDFLFLNIIVRLAEGMQQISTIIHTYLEGSE